ncbi:TonB-dependent receptor [Hymenobacter gummosus]|uniref:TonB-dependent receptor n=1 Tax=Hymenobacter gummosus TaxID=1776032 RepID=A0A431U4Q5_9BACT|nr:TonB-dependent receptor [Hymenobacter gummosus]RTQ50920.1 TonB-dependent receptor [Hymenobacter gummosus]
MSKYLLLATALLAAPAARAQAPATITVRGHVVDARTGEALPGAAVVLPGSGRGATTDAAGRYSLTLPAADSVRLTATLLGYAPQTATLAARRASWLDFRLPAATATLGEVQVRGQRPEEAGTTPGLSTLRLSRAELKRMPPLLGETDVLRPLQLLPGVQGGAEGRSALYVRGGSPDQTLVLLDAVPVYSVTHLGGFLSTLDANAVESVQLVKGGFPARYGGRLSSVLDVKLREGDARQWHGEAALGVLATRLALHGPLRPGRSTALLTVRRGNLDLLSRPLSFRSAEGRSTAGYAFHDATLKLTERLSPRQQLSLLAFTGADRLFIKDKEQETRAIGSGGGRTLSSGGSDLRYGSRLAALRWQHELSARLGATFTAGVSSFFYRNGQTSRTTVYTGSRSQRTDAEASFRAGITDGLLRADATYAAHPAHALRLGAGLTLHDFRPGLNHYFVQEAGQAEPAVDSTFGAPRVRATELMLYAEDTWQPSPRLTLNGGLHLVRYAPAGRHWLSAQPRLSVVYALRDHLRLTASVATMRQFVHLLTNNGAGLPLDLWVPATAEVPPQRAVQATAGATWAVPGPAGLELGAELFGKQLRGLIDFREGATFYHSTLRWAERLELGGQGRVAGLELLARKKQGRTTGWVGYTLSRNERRFQGLNAGGWFPFKYDQRHAASVVLMRELKKRVQLTATWQYSTGNALTLALAQYTAPQPGTTNPDLPPADPGSRFQPARAELYGPRNGFRMRAYHRLDVGATFPRRVRHGERVWQVGLYNAYSRQNPYYLYFDNDRAGRWHLYQLALFPILPAVSYVRRW